MTNKKKMLDYQLHGKVAVVTGAGGGMGNAIAEVLAQSGATVVLLDLNVENLIDLKTHLVGLGTAPMTVSCDVSDETAVSDAAQQVLKQLGRCDLLVNNAGILLPASPLEDISLLDWDRLQAINLRGVFLCAKYFCKDMLARRQGSIINIASIAAREPNANGAYGASKAAVAALTRQMAVEWGPRGVRSNSVSPGFIETPLSADFYAAPGMRDLRTSMVASRSIGSPLDIANAVAFLASEAAGFINGQDLVVDGGFTLTSLMRAQPEHHQPKA